MNAEKIYQELSRKGYNASIIAEAIGVLPQSVAVVIRIRRIGDLSREVKRLSAEMGDKKSRAGAALPRLGRATRG